MTTEDPANNFAPTPAKSPPTASGGGIRRSRLDGGNAFTGAEISPYYDSLLVKVTSWDNTFEGVCRKAMRAISEEHVRGVKTNIPFVTNILAHPTFRAGACHTKFIDETPELFDIDVGRDRATKLLKYIAQIQVDNPSAERAQFDIPRFPPYEHTPPKCTGLKQLLDEKGPEAVRDWVLGQKKLLAIGDFPGISVLVPIAICFVLLVWFILNKTVFGKNVYAIGGNREAAVVSGVNVFKTIMGIFILASVLYGVAGVLEAARTAGATNNYGNGYELDAIAACVVGGVSLNGGVGKVSGIRKRRADLYRYPVRPSVHRGQPDVAAGDQRYHHCYRGCD